MASNCFSCFQAGVSTYNTVEDVRNKVAELKKDYDYLQDNTARLRRIISAVQYKVKIGTADQSEQGWLKTAEDLDGKLDIILEELDNKVKVDGNDPWWSTIGPSDLGRRTSQIQQRLQDRLKEPCAEQIDKSLSIIHLAQTKPVLLLLDRQQTVFVSKRNSDEFSTKFTNRSVQVIGIHGMIGIGKTTFLKMINDIFFKNRRGYDMVIFVPQSSNSNVEKEVQRIQDEIATRLGLHLPEGSEIRRQILCPILSRMNVLLLLDNLLHGVTLSSLGIPIPVIAPAPAKAPHAVPAADPTATPDNQSKLCKVVFTARRKFMGRKIGATVHEMELDLLDKEDARKMFKQKAWQHRSDSENLRKKQCKDEFGQPKSLEELADRVADMCGGLPLALDKIGELFQDKSRCEEWRTEIKRLRKPERASDHVHEGKVYNSLREAYDSLKDSHSKDDYSEKDCFLHCSLFPAGSSIEENELKCHWTAEEILGEARSNKGLHDYFDCAVSAIEELKRAHLLCSNGDNQYSVKLHNQFHCMARWIAETKIKGKIFRHSDGNYSELSTMLEECREQVNWISLINCMGNLVKIDCPKLSTLVIRESMVTKMEPDLFASTQESLKVLDLATCTIPQCQLHDFKISNLQYLNLSHTNITCFHFDPEKLAKLKFLDLSFTRNLIVMELKALSTLDHLQLLNLYYCGPCGGSQQSQSHSTLLLLEDVEKLKFLVDVAVTIRGNLAFQKLENFSKLNLTHSMVITNCGGIQLNLQVIAAAEKLEVLHIIHCSAPLHLAENAITRGKCFTKLCNVEIDNCWNLTDLTWLKYAEALQSLKIARCPQLTKVINPPAGTQPDQLAFDKLKNFELHNLGGLLSIFYTDLPFSSLESIIVRNCGQLGPIPIADNRDRKMRPVIKCNKKWWEGIEDNERKSRLRPEFLR